MNTIIKKVVVAISVAIGVIVARAEITHNWIGGSGNWSDATHWDAGTVPGADSSVSIMPTEDTVITMPKSNVVIDSLVFSTANGALTFKAYNMLSSYTFSVTNSFSMTGAEHAKALVFDQINMKAVSSNPTVIDTARITNFDQVEKLVVKNGSQIFLDCSANIGSLYLHENSIIHNIMDASDPTHNVIVADKLVGSGGYCRLRSYAEFGKYEGTKQVSCIIVQNGAVKILDRNSVRLVGGTGTLTENTKQIPITTQFNITLDNRDSYTLYAAGGSADRSFNMTTLDENGSIVPVSYSNCIVGFANATEFDNVRLTTGATLEEDVTVNAIYATGNGVVDLNGHTLTVKSGFIYFLADPNMYITNGVVKLETPAYLSHPKLDENRYVKCPMVSADNANYLSPIVGVCGDGMFSGQSKYLAEATGTVRVPYFGGSGNGGSRTITVQDAPNVIWEYEGHTAFPYIGTVKVSYTNGLYRGFAGCGYVFYCVNSSNVKGIDGSAWLGEKGENDVILPQELIVGRNGYLLPGSPDENGHREGSMIFGACGSAEKGYTNLIFKAGSKYGATIHEDGSCTYIETKAWGTSKVNNNTKITIEGGDVVVSKAGKFSPAARTQYSIIRAHLPIEGQFDSVTPGYELKKRETVNGNVRTYEVILEAHPQGFSIIIR